MPARLPRRRVGALAVAAATLAGAATSPPTRATSIPGGRTALVAPAFVVPDGASGQPSVSADGRYVAFASAAINLTVPGIASTVPQIYVFDELTQTTRLVSATAAGIAADGPSSQPSISADGSVVAFTSAAANLVAGVARKTTNVFASVAGAPPQLLSVGVGGAPTDASSYQPAVSGNGRFVAFTSNADNLLAGDDNGKPDVFEYDLRTNADRRISTGPGGAQANGPSSNPAIDADGRFVTFASSASNLVGHHAAATEQVYVHDAASNRTALISLGRGQRRQNAAVPAPFTQISSISADGRFVAFDSNATNLSSHATNLHTNVYIRDRRRHRTTIASLSNTGDAGSDDSFAPEISPDAHYVIFDSLADDLAPGASPGPNVYVRDLADSATTTVDVSSNSRPRGPELRSGLLQQPVISRDATVAVFESGADNLVGTASNGVENLFVRLLAAPRTIAVHPPAATTSSRPGVEYRADDPLATFGLCRIDNLPRVCPLGRFALPKLRRGAHVLSFAAGGNGMLFDPAPIVTRFRVR